MTNKEYARERLEELER